MLYHSEYIHSNPTLSFTEHTGGVTFVLSNIGAPTSPKINGKSQKGKQFMYSSATLSGGLRALTVDLGFARRIQLLFCVNISSKFSSMVALLVVFLPCRHKPYPNMRSLKLSIVNRQEFERTLNISCFNLVLVFCCYEVLTLRTAKTTSNRRLWDRNSNRFQFSRCKTLSHKI